ncbi:hypothetical protein [Ruegeria sp.]|uniref:hypothetical protein n=1 Tax=Ruegeria sp. TaxID=1879320 RepID=UPI003AFF725B
MQEDDGLPARPKEAGRTAELLDAGLRLEETIEALRAGFDTLQADSGEITEKIMGDLAGIRAEQMYLARRIDRLGAELRVEIRKELARTTGAGTQSGPDPSRRPLRGILGRALLALLLVSGLAFAWLAGVPASLDLPEGLLEWLPE